MKKKNTCCGMLTSEFMSLFTQPWFWIAILLVGIVQFLNLIYGEFGSGFMYESMGMDAFRQYSVVYLSVFADTSYFSWARYCIAAFPVVASFAQDVKQNRLTFIFPRSGYLSYAVAKVVATFIGAFLCMFLGDMLFCVVAHWGLGMPLVERYSLSDGIINHLTLSENSLRMIFLLALELNHALEAAYYALLTLVISYWIHENHFLSIMPLLLRFIISYYMPYFDSSWNLLWTRYIHPVPIYRYLGWGLFQQDALPQLGYGFVYTMIIVALVIVFFYVMLKWHRKSKGNHCIVRLAWVQNVLCYLKKWYEDWSRARQNLHLKEHMKETTKKSWLPASVHRTIAVWSFDVWTSVFSIKWLILSIVSFGVVHSAMSEYVKYALDYHLFMPPVGFAAMLTNPLGSFFLIYIASSFPLKNPLQKDVWIRSGCAAYTNAQILTMISLFVVWILEMHVFILINMIGCVEWTNDWGNVWQASAMKLESLGYLRRFAFEEAVMNYYTPFQALGTYVLLAVVTGFLFSEFIFLLDGLSNRHLGEVILVLWVLAWEVVDRFVYSGGYSKVWQYLSPEKWLDLRMYINNVSQLRNTLFIMIGVGVLLYLGNQIMVKKKLLILD